MVSLGKNGQSAFGKMPHCWMRNPWPRREKSEGLMLDTKHLTETFDLKLPPLCENPALCLVSA